MSLTGFLHVFPLLIAGVLSILLAIYARRRESSQLVDIFTYLMGFISLWSIGYLIQLGTPGFPMTIFWAKVKYIGVAMVPAVWFVFALKYTRPEREVSGWAFVFLFAFPVVHLFLIWSNSLHHVFWEGLELSAANGLTALDVAPGLGFWTLSAYSYLFVLAGCFLLFRMLIGLGRLYLKQGLVLAGGVAVPVVSNLVHLSGVTPWVIDLTPFFFTVTGVAIWWSIFRYKFLDVVPRARANIQENIPDAMLVLDKDDRIIDINRAMEELVKDMTSSGQGEMIGENVEDLLIGGEAGDLLPSISELESDERETGSEQTEIKLTDKQEWRFYDMRGVPLYDERDRFVGRVVVLRDITERKEAEERKDFLQTLLRQDLRSKYQTIEGYLQLIEEIDLPDEQEEYLKKTIKVGREAGEILGLVKKLEEVEASRMMLEEDVTKVLENVNKDIFDLTKREKIEIEKNYPETIGEVQADYSLDTLLSQIIKTRISIAKCDKIRINTKETEKNIILTIEDNGEKLLREIKNLFSGEAYTGKTAGAGGVRYYILREIAEHNNARIEVKGSELGGAKFDIHLEKT